MSGYTPEQLREWADDWEKDAAGYTENWRRTVYRSHAAQLRAHADALEQLSAAQADLTEAIKHGGAFSRARITCNGYSDWSKEALDEAFEAFRVWMEERE